MSEHTTANDQGQLSAFGRALLAHPILDESTDGDQQPTAQEVGGYIVPMNPMDELQCDSCQ